MADTTHAIPQSNAKNEPGFVRAIGLFDGTMIVVGSMIGSGIFIVAADISRQTGSAGGLLSHLDSHRTVDDLCRAFLRRASRSVSARGRQYVYLRELIRRYGDFFTAGRFSW